MESGLFPGVGEIATNGAEISGVRELFGRERNVSFPEKNKILRLSVNCRPKAVE
jgi:hypothetical protein